MHPNKILYLLFPIREWTILSLFFLLTLVMLYPLSFNISTMIPEPTDPLLNVWRMQWNVRAFLSGPEALANVFDTNIFYPFPLTLAYSEHFLLLAAQALPFLLISESHLLGMNLSVLVTFTLSGYAMYLLITAWTGQRWAGFIAGVLFAFSPYRFGQLNHLELLVTQWIPFTLLALHWTLTRPGRRYPLLFVLFFNLQALSGFHFTLNLTIACVLLALIYTLSKQVYWRWGLGLTATLAIAATLLLNWPIWQIYLRFSDVMGAVRTPGEVRIYSAALTDYFTAIPYSWLYGWTFGRWQSPDHQFQPLMPFGLIGLGLALFGVLSSKWFHQTVNLPNTQATRQSFTVASIISLGVLTLLALLLSFGLNEEALGPNFASLLKFSPYVWLYNHITFFQGIRVPARFGILGVVGLVGLAGWGVKCLSYIAVRNPWAKHSISVGSLSLGYAPQPLLMISLIVFILLEAWSVPLIGPTVPTGAQLPPVYSWLQTQTTPAEVVLELPYQNSSEFMYEYYSSYHWRRLLNGGTGFTPPIYKEMRQWFKTFPDTRSVDVIQHLGVNRVILHSTAYPSEEWRRLLANFPLYLPAFSRIDQVGEALVLQIVPPVCQPQPRQMSATLTSTAGPDGLSNVIQVTYRNAGVAAFVTDVRQASRLIFTDQTTKNFTEPLVTPAGETQSILTPLSDDRQAQDLAGAWLATLDHTISVAVPPGDNSLAEIPTIWQPLGLRFADGPQLVAYSLTPEKPAACSQLSLALKWSGGQVGDTVTVRLLDPFGRVVNESITQPWLESAPEVSETRHIPLPGSLPAGRYGVKVYVHTAAGQERMPVTETGVTIPTDQLPSLPLVIHPLLYPATLPVREEQPVWGGVMRLLDHQLAQTDVSAGDWLRFTLVWQADRPLSDDLTVFTQLVGSDGRVWGQWDNQPRGGWYSTSLWPPGQPVADDYAFQVAAETPAGTYRLITGLYDSATQKRLPVWLAADKTADFVELGLVQVSLSEGQRANP